MKRKFNNHRLLLISGLFALFAIWFSSLPTLENQSQRIWVTLILSLIGILFFVKNQDPIAIRYRYLQIILQTILASILFVFQPGWTVFPIVFFILSPQVMLDFPLPIGIIWLGIFTLIMGINMVSVEGLNGLLHALPYTAGYAFFGMFGWVMVQAEQERKRSEQLLDELREAHGKLQEYTTQIEELAIAEERNRIAREMHDNLGHRLTIAAVQLEGAQRLVVSNPQKAEQMIGTVREQVREGLSDVRRTVALLREPVKEIQPLPEVLNLLVNDVRDATGIQISLSILGKLDFISVSQPREVSIRQAVFRAVQEGLTNIQRHANASEAWINLFTEENWITLEIMDNGTGFIDMNRDYHFGLTGLKERAELLGGTFQTGTRPGGGAQITMRLPYLREVSQ